MIEQGRPLEFPLNKRVVIYGLPVEFSVQQGELIFREIPLGQNNLEILVPNVRVPAQYDFIKAIVIKKDITSVAALVFGVDTADNNQPAAAIFNLTRAEDLRVIAKNGSVQPVKNDQFPPGNLDLNELLRKNPEGRMVEFTTDSQSLIITLAHRLPGGI